MLVNGDSIGAAVRREMTWLAEVINVRIRSHFEADTAPASLPAPPALEPASSRFADFVAHVGAHCQERVLLALALAPHMSPHTLDVFFLRNQQTDRGFTEFGGLKGAQHTGFVPTGETALFLVAGDDVDARVRAMRLFDPDSPLFARGVLQLGAAPSTEPLWSGALSLAPAYLRHLVTGDEPRPELGPGFPARPVGTQLAWDDLVLDPNALAEVRTISAWARHRRELLEDWGLGRQLSPGFTALFYGPPGTGKTLTAGLLGKELKTEVYRVDLSQVVSKYIGETEKNLATVFAEAERRGWILFFDEADALFGKRTATSSAHDRYANQEVSFLLQRIEEHTGIVILATNFRANIDEAFLRRFHATIHFSAPDARQRARLWRGILGPGMRLDDDVNIDALAREHELTGGQIVNVVRHASLMAVQRASVVSMADLTRAIRREQRKEGWNG